MSSTTSPQYSTGAGRLGAGPVQPLLAIPDGSSAQPAPRSAEPGRAVAVRAGQLLVWVLVTAPIALVLMGLFLALIGAVFALVSG